MCVAMECCITNAYYEPLKGDVCSQVVVKNAYKGDCNGVYKLTSKAVSWAPSKLVYEHVSKDRFIFWNDHGYGWSIGSSNGLKTGSHWHKSKLETSEPWQGNWNAGVTVTCDICSKVVVKNADRADCNGIYKLTSKSVAWAPSRPVYAHESKDRYIFWNNHGHGWSIGNANGLKTGGHWHESRLESDEPWQGYWKAGVSVTCKGGEVSGNFKCGEKNSKLTTFIIGGTETDVNEYPWQVALVFNGRTWPFCGGSIIGDRWILTAAHCVEETYSPSQIQVLLGEHDYRTSSESDMVRMNVARIISHPTYRGKSSGFDYDFALLQLDSVISFSANIRPVCLPSDVNEDYAGRSAIYTGWGKTESGRGSSFLREVDVDILSNRECTRNDRFSWRKGQITDRMICAAGARGRGRGKGSCKGDSGGPLVALGPGRKYEVIGVVSFGVDLAQCGEGQYNSVAARTTSVLRWIKQNTSR